MDQTELRQAIRDLYLIDQAGLLDEFREDLCFERRNNEPKRRENCTTGEYLVVSQFAGLAVRLFDVSEDLAMGAAYDALLRTERRVVLNLIAEYRARIDGANPAQQITAPQNDRPPVKPIPAKLVEMKGGRQ